MSHIAEVARLKELEEFAAPAPISIARVIYEDGNHLLQLYKDPTDKTGCSNFGATLEDKALLRGLRNVAPWLLAVAGQFQAGDVDLLDELIEYIDFLIPSGLEAVGESDEEFEVIPDDQKLLIRAKDGLYRMLAAARVMESEQE